MKSRLWLNLILVVIVAILAALVYFKPGTHKPKASIKLTNRKAADIQSIKIERDGMPTVELARTGEAWQMITPQKLSADTSLVKTLLDSLDEDVSSSFPVKQTRLSQYGLDPPHLRLWLDGTEFDFGDTDPIHNNRYVKTGDTVYLTDSLLYFRANHSPLWWANKRLLPKDAHIVGLQLPDMTLTLKGIKWQLTPEDPAISSDAIQQLVDNWKNAQAIGTAKIGSGKPEGEVAIELAGDNQPVRFAILKSPDFLILARPDLGLEYELDSSQRSALLELKAAKASAKSEKKSAKLPSHLSRGKPSH
jgi:hypothetical protein